MYEVERISCDLLVKDELIHNFVCDSHALHTYTYVYKGWSFCLCLLSSFFVSPVLESSVFLAAARSFPLTIPFDCISALH